MQENTASAAPAPPASARPPLMAAFRELAAWAATHGLRMEQDPASLSYADLEAAVDFLAEFDPYDYEAAL